MSVEIIREVDYQGVPLTEYRCSCGSTFYAKTGDAEVKSCGHERARRDPGSFEFRKTRVECKQIVERIGNGTATDEDKELAARLFKGVVRRGAYELWERAGRPDGMADHFWYESERMFRAYLAST